MPRATGAKGSRAVGPSGRGAGASLLHG